MSVHLRSIKKTKYRAIKTQLDGRIFSSKKEAADYSILKLRQRAGEISELELQPKFPLIMNGTIVCKYVADFTWLENGLRVIADSKGMKTPMYRLKRKMMKAQYGVDILEL